MRGPQPSSDRYRKIDRLAGHVLMKAKNLVISRLSCTEKTKKCKGVTRCCRRLSFVRSLMTQYTTCYTSTRKE